MTHAASPGYRAAALGASLLMSVALLSGCSTAASGNPSPSITEGQRAVIYPEIREALAAADPRVADVGITDSRSGAARVLTVGVIVSGDEALSSESLTALLVAIRGNLPDGIDQLNLLVRDDTEKSRILDISTAVAGLPSDVTVLYDGTLTIMRGDLEKIDG